MPKNLVTPTDPQERCKQVILVKILDKISRQVPPFTWSPDYWHGYCDACAKLLNLEPVSLWDQVRDATLRNLSVLNSAIKKQ